MPTLVILAILLVLLLVFASIWTDVLWYRQLGFLRVLGTEMVAKTILFLLGAVVMGAAVLGSLVIAYRSRPVYAPVSMEQASLERYREGLEPMRRLVTVALPVIIGLFAGSAAAQQWQTTLLWLNRTPFGVDDPQFGMDVGFFVFTLPWLQFLSGFFTAVVFLAGLAALVTHYLYGGLRLQGVGNRITSAARLHLGVVAAVFLLLRAVDYWLGRYALSTKQSQRIPITGLTYTDANAVLTARGVLAVIATMIAVLFLVGAFVERWRLLPLYGVALLVVSAIIIGGIYPAIVQRFQVTPNALTLERTYIQRAIQATRDAYGLSDVEVIPYAARSKAEAGALRDSAETVPGIRLLDPLIVDDAFRQLEQNKQYYAFPDSLDVDRYTIEGKTRDTVIAVRELDLGDVPAAERNWVNDHLVYTHGFGVVAAHGNRRASDGKPVFYEGGIPPNGELGRYEPRVYFGERSPVYSVVGGTSQGRQMELDYPDDASPNGQRNTTYTGQGGVPVGSLWTRLLYAIKFQDQNLVLNGDMNDQSRILYDRSPRERIAKVAPFLTLDGDPYPAVVDGRVVWIVDGYTTTERYPYSSTQILQEATADSLTETTTSVVALEAQRVNYMRNSVKATVDAYDGKVTLYAWDENDPVLKAWSKVFPGIVEPASKISGSLMAHLRYPEDLFKVQRQLLTRYHVTDAGAFFGGQDFWRIPDDPTRGQGEYQPPYYLTLQMPRQESTAFSLTSTFIPVGGQRNVLTGFLAVDADAGSQAGRPRDGYGQMRLLQLPRDTVVPGPGQVQNNFNASPEVSTELNLLRGGGSKVENGNLLTLPVGDGLLYVQPVYVRGQGTGTYPLLQRVLVAFGDQDRIGFAPTLDEALDEVFGGDSGANSGDSGGTPPPDTDDGKTPDDEAGQPSEAQKRLQAALTDAAEAMRDSDKALKAGDFAAYGAAQKRLNEAVQRAMDAEADMRGSASPTSTTSTTTTTTTTTAGG
ncbi:MAG: UPF0182 family protein [Actinomycetales bacterium]|nr:UPF0182 family protein [Actinomycetales bacterium]